MAKGLFHLLKYSVWFLPSLALAQITDPTDIANLVHWVDAQNINGDGTAPADGAAVNTWTDLSTSGLNLASGGGLAAPTYDEDGWNAGNNCPALLFGAGGVSSLKGGNPFSAGNMQTSTVFTVFREVNRRSAALGSFNGGTFGADQAYILVWEDNRLYQRISGPLLNGNPGLAAGTDYFASFVSGITGNPRREIRVNGNQIASTNNTATTTPTAGGINLGWTWSPTQYYFDGYIAEMVIYDRKLNATEISDVENYLTTRWNNACNQDVDLAVSKAAFSDATCLTPLPLPTTEGTPIHYCITVTNNGPGEATNVELEDVLPLGVTYQNTSDPGNTTYAP